MTKLKDITGKALSGEWGTDDETGVGIPVLRTTNFTNEGIVNYENVVTRIITKKDISEKYLQSGDIIIEKSGGSDKQPVGRVIYFDGPENTYLFNNFTGLLRVRDKNEWFPRYVFYSLFANYKKGGTRPFENKTTGLHNLKTDDYVSRYEITEIPLNKQVTICAQLDQILKVINLRRKEISNLDDLIKARFVEMFGNPATPGDKFKTCKLGEVADVKSSHRVFTTEFVDEGVPFYRGTEIGVLASGQRPEDPYRISMEHYLKIASDDSKPIRGDLLLPSICNKGQVWMVDTDEPFYYKDGRVLCISPNQSVFDPRYLQLYMKMRTEAEYPKLGSGSTFAEFKIFQLKKLEIDIPPMDLQNQFAEFVTQIDKSKLLSGCRLFHSWAPENRDKPKHVGVPRRRTKDLRGGRRQQ